MRGELSPFVVDCVQKLGLPPGAKVLDIPAGWGRHARWLAAGGAFVVAADIDEKRLASIANGSTPQGLHPVLANADRSLPFEPETFDLVLVVHFFRDGFAIRMAELLKAGGHLVFETFGGQGENWRDLPTKSALLDEVAGCLRVRNYIERPAGPPEHRRTVAKLFAEREAEQSRLTIARRNMQSRHCC